MLVGAMTLENDEGERWVEQLYLSDHGEERWLSIDEGERYMFTELSTDELKRSTLPLTVEELLRDNQVTYEGRTYTRDEQGGARITGMRGELDDEYELGERYFYWQGYDEDDEDSLSAEWDEEGKLRWSHGVWRSGGSEELNSAHSHKAGGCLSIFTSFILFQLVVGSLFMGGHRYTNVGSFDVPFKSAVSEAGQIEFETPIFEFDGPQEAQVELVMPAELKNIIFNAYLKPVDERGEAREIVLKDWGRSADHALIEELKSRGVMRYFFDPVASYVVSFGVPTGGRYVLKLSGAGEPVPPTPPTPPAPPQTLKPSSTPLASPTSSTSSTTGKDMSAPPAPSAPSAPLTARTPDPIAVFVDANGYSTTLIKGFWLLMFLAALLLFNIKALREALFARFGSPLKAFGVIAACSLVIHLALTQYSRSQSAHQPVKERYSRLSASRHVSHFLIGGSLYMSGRWVGMRRSHSLRARSSRIGRSHSGFGGGK
jgi:hypothetical protein